VVRNRLGARKASFAPVDDALAATGMEYGGITPIGLPPSWPLLIDSAVVQQPYVIIGSGIRGSKLLVPGPLLARLPAAEVIEGLGAPPAAS
jgi:prolyl-tRNA editing enzyme YbaK/EbsC (Cys-tRNA(Pro) deacylase)